MMARRFLAVVAGLAVLVIAGAIVWRLMGDRLVAFALTPRLDFGRSVQADPPDYAQVTAWIAHPDRPDSPAKFVPQGFRPAPAPAAATFFVAPTAYFARTRWNAPLDDPATNERLDRFIQGQGSIFNGVSDVWSPRYRQATFGSFFRVSGDSEAALDLAYHDVDAAFTAFLAAQPEDRPIILGGHSQGARHLLRLIAARVAGTPLADRVVAVYAIGWPVAAHSDLARLGLPACDRRDQSGCLLSWQSFAADGDHAGFLKGVATVPRVDGQPFGTEAMVCTNPLTGVTAPPGRAGSFAPAEANAGALKERELVPRLAGAQCKANGLLVLDPTPRDIGPYVLPNGNFHVYDLSLFWAGVRADAEARLMAHAARTLKADR